MMTRLNVSDNQVHYLSWTEENTSEILILITTVNLKLLVTTSF